MTTTAEPGFIPDFHAIKALAQKEFLDSVRSKWILVLTILFIVLTLIFSVLAAALSGGSAGFQGFETTAGAMSATVILFIPMMGLMLSYASIAGEREQGSLQLLLAYPITRLEAILGKVLGLGAVASVSILSGLGLSGLIVAAFAGTAHWDGFLLFVGGAVLLAVAFVSVGVFFSSLTKKRSVALGVGIFLWFFFFLIYDLVIFGIYLATGGALPSPGTPPPPMPDWILAIQMANPGNAFGFFTQLIFPDPQGAGLPRFINPLSTVGVMIVWIMVPAALAVLGFQRKDL